MEKNNGFKIGDRIVVGYFTADDGQIFLFTENGDFEPINEEKTDWVKENIDNYSSLTLKKYFADHFDAETADMVMDHFFPSLSVKASSPTQAIFGVASEVTYRIDDGPEIKVQ